MNLKTHNAYCETRIDDDGFCVKIISEKGDVLATETGSARNLKRARVGARKMKAYLSKRFIK